jgi:hypothetical protein
MVATWLQSCGPPLGFGDAVQGQRGQFPPGRASEAGARAPARLVVRDGRGPARTSRVRCVHRCVRQEEEERETETG